MVGPEKEQVQRRGLPGLNEQGAGGLASWLPERRALETQILGSDKGEGVCVGSWRLGGS